MNRFDAREMAVRLYYTATGRHDVDDSQWNLILDTFNRKYWRDAARNIGSLLSLDTPDLNSNVAGGFDYSGSIFQRNEASYPTVFSATAWTNTNVTLQTGHWSPIGDKDATLITPTANPGAATLTITMVNYRGGTVDIYAKQSGLSSPYLYLTTSAGSCWFNLSAVASVATNQIAGSVASITPLPYNGFPYQVGATSTVTPVVSPTGYYKCSVNLPSSVSITSAGVGISNADAVTTTDANTGMIVWGFRRSPDGTGQNASNLADPRGVYMVNAVELKYLGRYIHLDYEIPQDRYIYNIAFGQIQALIPNAFTIMGEQVLLLPKTTGGQVIRLSYIPRLTDWISDSMPALNGFLPDWHEIVPHEAATAMAFAVDPKGAAALMALRTERRQQWTDFVQSRQRQDGRKIRFVPYE